jgi:hypothetical protein
MVGFGTNSTAREPGFSRYRNVLLLHRFKTCSYKNFLHLSGSTSRMFNAANTKATALTELVSLQSTITDVVSLQDSL